MFPYTLNGFLKIYTKDDTLFIKKFNEQIENKFSKEKALYLIKYEDSFIIKGEPLRFTWKGFHLLNGVSKLKIGIKKEGNHLKINYRFYFLEVLILALLFSIIPIFTSPKLILHFQKYDYNIQQWLFFIIWGLFFFGNILVSFVRFYFFLKKEIKAISYDIEDYITDNQLSRIKELNNKLSSSMQNGQNSI